MRLYFHGCREEFHGDALSTFLPRPADRRLPAGGAAADGHAAVFGLAHASASPSRAAARCRARPAAATLEPRAGEPHRLRSSASRCRSRYCPTRSCGTISRARTRASSRLLGRAARCCRSRTSQLAALNRTIEQEQALYAYVAGAAARRPELRTVRAHGGRAGRRCLPGAGDQLLRRRPRSRAPWRERRRRAPAADRDGADRDRARARRRARADAPHRAADRRDRLGDPPAGQRRFRAPDPRQAARRTCRAWASGSTGCASA